MSEAVCEVGEEEVAVECDGEAGALLEKAKVAYVEDAQIFALACLRRGDCSISISSPFSIRATACRTTNGCRGRLLDAKRLLMRPRRLSYQASNQRADCRRDGG